MAPEPKSGSDLSCENDSGDENSDDKPKGVLRGTLAGKRKQQAV